MRRVWYFNQATPQGHISRRQDVFKYAKVGDLYCANTRGSTVHPPANAWFIIAVNNDGDMGMIPTQEKNHMDPETFEVIQIVDNNHVILDPVPVPPKPKYVIIDGVQHRRVRCQESVLQMQRANTTGWVRQDDRWYYRRPDLRWVDVNDVTNIDGYTLWHDDWWYEPVYPIPESYGDW